MRRFLSVLVLILCLLPAGCGGQTAPPDDVGSADPESSEVTVTELAPEDTLDALSQMLLDKNPSYLSYDPETGFETEALHYVWWTEEPPVETEIDGQTAYEFQLLYGPDADDGLPPEQDTEPMAGRLAAIYAVAKDGSACWEYGIGTDMWTLLDDTNDPILSPEEAQETLADYLIAIGEIPASMEADEGAYSLVWASDFFGEPIKSRSSTGSGRISAPSAMETRSGNWRTR